MATDMNQNGFKRKSLPLRLESRTVCVNKCTDITGTCAMEREEFLARFKTELRRLLPAEWDEHYVNHIAPTYWDDKDQRADGPEDCAAAEAHEWGQE